MNKPKTPAERKRSQREREKARGAKRISIMFYRGTLECIDELCAARGLTDTDRIPELITTMIHAEHKKLNRDMSQE